jgi:hypothetical protein
MKQGIIIIATKHHLYGRLAYNLALTIKATGTKVPVALVYDKEAIAHLSEEDLKMFDEKIETTSNWNKVRFNIDVLSPFDYTMQLDADILWLWRDPQELFDKYPDEELLVTNEGYYNIETKEEKLTGGYMWHADVEQSIKLYKLKGIMYQMRWEIILFKKTEHVRQMFITAEKIIKKPKLETWKFEGQPVDEFAFYIACNQLALIQKESPFVPAYWCHRLSNPLIADINKKWYAVHFGGNAAHKEYKRIYNTIMQVACKKLGLQFRFGIQSKSEHLTSRISV